MYPFALEKKIGALQSFRFAQSFVWMDQQIPDTREGEHIVTQLADTNRLANPLIRSVLYGGKTHVHPLTAVKMLRRFGRMRYNNQFTWSNLPGTPIQAFRKWMKDFKF